MTSASSPDPIPDLQPELQPKPQKPAPDLDFDEFDEIETALPALDVIPHPAPVVTPVVEPVAKVADPDGLTPFPFDQVVPATNTKTDAKTDTKTETVTEIPTTDATSDVAAPVYVFVS